MLNTTGMWIDRVNRLASDGAKRRVTGTKGAHIMVKLPEECRGQGVLSELRDGNPFYTILRRREDLPGLSLDELTHRIGQELGRPITDDQFRQLANRAQGEFSRILLEEVVATLPPGAPFEEIERELIETGLLAFCRLAVARARPDPKRR